MRTQLAALLKTVLCALGSGRWLSRLAHAAVLKLCSAQLGQCVPVRPAM